MSNFKQIVLILSLSPIMSNASDFDQAPAWPLCGRISENPPADWDKTDGCPSDRWGNPDHTDMPLSSTFGPRQKASENYRYDYHRGIDIPTEMGTPIFAIADGIVKIAGNHSAYSDALVQLRHYRPGHSSCYKIGCYYSNYTHLQSWTVSANQSVSKGDLIGYTGKSVSGFAHLHFEIRNSPSFDYYSVWQRDAIHPLHVLPYKHSSVPTITFDSVDTTLPNSPVVQLTVSTPRLDVTGVALVIYDKNYQSVIQAGDTADAKGYNVNPPWFKMDEWNFQYSHKNSSKYPWSSFQAGGNHECPHHDKHGSSYNANVHADLQDPSDSHAGLFNGVRIAPATYNTATPKYSLTLTFNALKGPAHCIEAQVFLATGNTARQQWGDCSGLK